MNKVWKFHNDVDTDQIIASQYLLLPDIEAMKQYADKADAYIREHAIVLSSWFQKITIK